MEQLARGHNGIGGQHLTGAVHCLVAEFLDYLGLGEHGPADNLGEGGLVDKCAQIVLVGETQATVMLVEPGHRQFQRAPGIEARGPRIDVGQALGAGGRLV